MLRSVSLLALVAGLGFASPVLAADWQWDEGMGGMRDSYPDDWNLEEDNPIAVEAGVRYWYSMGQHDMQVIGDTYSSRDTSHVIEGVLRVEEPATGWYGRATGGYSAAISNDFTTPTRTAHLDSGEIRYVSGDVGWRALGNETLSSGGFAGYQYWNDSPDMWRESFTGGLQSVPNKIEYHMLRLGFTTKAVFGEHFELEGEIAAVPYAMIQGQYGAFVHPDYNDPAITPASPGKLGGWLYGGTAEVMARFRPDQNWSIGVGARAWYLTGQADFTFESTADNWITKTQQFSTFRYGLLGEVSYKF
jgi:hypothetical protein